MKFCFEEPNIEVIRFYVEDVVTSSGVRTGGIGSGFDEMEPDMEDYTITILPIMPPCA